MLPNDFIFETGTKNALWRAELIAPEKYRISRFQPFMPDENANWSSKGVAASIKNGDWKIVDILYDDAQDDSSTDITNLI